jgi:hypothetical protein
MLGVTETDRLMWFSMWFLASIASFGLALFPMFYYMIRRRNKHFLRQIELEKRVSAFLKREETLRADADSFPERNAKLWTVSLVFVFPVFVIAYFLSEDLRLHEERQQTFLTSLFPEREFIPQSIPVKKYAIITIVTLGVGIVYWLYKILNIYNNHFSDQQKIEGEIFGLMEEESHGEFL